MTPAPAPVLIYRYTRAQALGDGSLIDLSAEASEAGIKYPVAITALAFDEAVEMTDMGSQMGCDKWGRRWDVVWMLRCAMVRARPGDAEVRFKVLVVGNRRTPEEVELRAVVGPGDKAEPVVTIMLPGED